MENRIKKNMEQIIKSVWDWQEATFKKATPTSSLHHLKEEISEIHEELHRAEFEKDSKKIESEYADAFILLFGSAKLAGYDFEKIAEIIQNKMDINLERKWQEPNAEGLVFHVKEKDNEAN